MARECRQLGFRLERWSAVQHGRTGQRHLRLGVSAEDPLVVQSDEMTAEWLELFLHCPVAAEDSSRQVEHAEKIR